MFANRFSESDNSNGTATLTPSTNGKAKRQPKPSRNGKHGSTSGGTPSTNGANGAPVGEAARFASDGTPSTNGANGLATPVDLGPDGHLAPSINGDERDDGETLAKRAASPTGTETGRNANGQFAKGNRGGPGNPFARQTAALRQALLNRTTPEDIQEIAGKLIELAKGGDVQAAKVVFAYTIGKPQPAPNPDDMDIEEWRGYQREAGMLHEVKGIIDKPASDLPISIIRAARPSVTDSTRMIVGNLMTATPAEGREFFGRVNAMPATERAAETAKLGKPLDVAEYLREAREKENRQTRRARRRKARRAKRPSPNGK